MGDEPKFDKAKYVEEHQQQPKMPPPVEVRSANKGLSRTIREFEVIESDRVPLITEANVLVRNLGDKMMAPLFSNITGGQEAELTEVEQQAYDSALAYLTRQFNQGFSDTDRYEIRAEQEDSYEIGGDSDGQ